jgi:predicted helicase
MKTDSLKLYIDELNKQYKTGLAREHSYRPALKDLLQSLLPKMVVTNEPAHFECGAPDYIIQREKDHLPVFFVEAKDVNDNDLDGRNKNAHKEQFDRYKQALDYIIFTDYLDFHLYEHGEFVDSVRIAEIKGEKIVGIAEAEDKFLVMIQHLGASAIQRVTSASRLAKLMAGKARLLANIIEQAMNDDTDSYANDNLRGQYQAFKDVLIQELKPTDFADIYAQTIAYGMFAARLHDDTPESFSREEAARLIPKTNPFLRQIFNNLAGNDLDERIAWVVDDLVTVFQATDLQKIMASYSRDKLHHDPMIHFYEDFLSEYNPKLRKSKGVWYTPQPVVGFIVRAVDEILQKDFGLPEGLADYSMIEREVAVEQSRDKRTSDGMKHEKHKFHRVQILDPATGTGTFLAEVVNQIYDRYRDNQGIWQQYVEQHLLPRLNGFEILMASYAVAHIKLDMLLSETGYQHNTDKRLHVYLTNSLEESNNEPRTLFAQWLSREATEANVIKRDYPVMVMIGNPPYSISSQNKGEWINKLLEDYKKNLNERNIQPLSDDYIKFMRLGQYYVEKNNSGILAFISNNGFIDGVIHRQIRKELLRAFDKIYILDLHGNSRKKETAPDGSKDENVFDIMQGVSINIFVKKTTKERTSAEVYHYDLYGSRDDKYHFLNENYLNTVAWKQLEPQTPQFFFVPKDFASQEEYDKGFAVKDLFCICNAGSKTERDSLNIHFTDEERLSVLKDFKELSINELVEKYHTKDSRDWQVMLAQKDLQTNPIIATKISYRPLDIRYINYTGKTKGIMGYPRFDIMCHMIHPNISMCLVRNNRRYEETYFISNGISDKSYISSNDDITVFPLYAYKENMGEEERIVNFNKDIYEKIAKGLNYLPCYDDNMLIDPTSDYDGVLYPQDLFDYIYAVLHSPSYRERYKEFLKIDFPRIPYPTDWEKFRDLVEKGEELRHLHLMEDLPHSTGVSFPVSGTMQVDCYRWEQNRVYINSEQYFEGVPESAWNFYIGGYQPAQKWLKDRKGMTLSFEDVRHYQHIIYVLQQTERIMQEIDEIKCQRIDELFK